MPDGTILYGEDPVRLIAWTGKLSKVEWEEQEEKNFPEEERWHILPWDETAYRNRWGTYRESNSAGLWNPPSEEEKAYLREHPEVR